MADARERARGNETQMPFTSEVNMSVTTGAGRDSFQCLMCSLEWNNRTVWMTFSTSTHPVRRTRSVTTVDSSQKLPKRERNARKLIRNKGNKGKKAGSSNIE